MPVTEDFLDNVIQELNHNSSPEDVLSRYPAHQHELTGVLNTLVQLQTMPKNSVPKPSLQRKYLLAPAHATVWHAAFHFSRFATIALSLAVFLTAAGTTVYATLQSLPGQTLFGLKKSAEQLQFKLISDPVEKANLYVTLSEKRLREAEKIISSSPDNIELQAAALRELTQQTQIAIAQVQKTTEEDTLSEKNQELVASLETVAKKQQELLQQVPAEQTKVALETSRASTETLDEIKRVITIATNNKEQALAELSDNPNVVQISGFASNLGSTTITVEKTPFLINDKTTVRDAAQNPLKLSDIKPGTKVNIRGEKEGEKITAQEIIVIAEPEKPEVKGSATSSTPSVKPVSTSSPAIIQKPADQPDTATSVEESIAPIIIEPTTAQGTFIIEDPSPHFIPADKDKELQE